MPHARLPRFRTLPLLAAAGALIAPSLAHAAPTAEASTEGNVDTTQATSDTSADVGTTSEAQADTTTASPGFAEAEDDELSGGTEAGAGSAGLAGAGAGGRRFRLHADTEFFGYTHVDDETAMPGPDINIVGFGFGRPPTVDAGGCLGAGAGCLLSVRPVWGLGFGYALLNQQAVIGARFAFTVDGVYDDDNQDDDETHLISGQLIPYFRWIFLPGQAIRPYVEARFGFGGGTVISKSPGPMGGDVKRTTNIIYPTIGAGGGAHFFLLDALSLDLGLNLDYYAPHARMITDPETPGASDDYEQQSNVVNLAVLAGFSVWIP